MGIALKASKWLCISLLFLSISIGVCTTAEAKRSLKTRISQYENKVKRKPDDVRAREKLARLYNKAKRFDKSIEVLAPYSNEASEKGLITLASAYRGSKDNLNEIRTLQFLVTKLPNRFRPHYLLGNALQRNGQLQEAIERYRLATRLAPKHLPSYNAMLKVFLEQKNFYEARLLVQDKIRHVGERKEFFNQLCELYAEDGFLKEGVAICQRAIKMNPGHPQNHVYLAQSYANQQKKEVAQRVFTNAAKRFKDSEFVLWSTGEFFFQNTNYPAAVRYLDQAVKADKTSARSLLGLALSLFEIASYDKALSTFLKSCKYDKSKESLTQLRTAIAKLRQADKYRWADKFTKKEHLCK